jgi:molybdopterin/thiamine biosynthesis adenylyltransferase
LKLQQFLRQRGLLDQEALMNKRILLSGSSGGIGDLFAILLQLGVGKGESGCIGVVVTERLPTSVFWKLMIANKNSWKDLLKYFAKQGVSIELISKDEVDNNSWDIHLSIEGTKDLDGDLNGFVNGMRGLISTSNNYPIIHDSTLHPVHISMRTIVAATMVHHSLKMMGVCKRIPVSDIWLTVTCRVETTDLQLARDHVRGLGGSLLDVTKSGDDLATIARYRLPLEHNMDTYSLIEVENMESEFSEDLDVGFISWSAKFSDDENKTIMPSSDICILGVGGLGSWATPLLCQALPSGKIHIIDGDDEVAVHNLNRQVLYQNQDIGKAKAVVAKKRLSNAFPHLQFQAHQIYLTRTHISKPDEGGVNLDELFSNNKKDEDADEKLRFALKNSDISLGCLDNMQARTILNEASLKSSMPMINGGGEAKHGIAERLHDEGCMICRYGNEAANAPEVISCTEEGMRPISSIVTTTAWVGAMMSAMTILELSDCKSHIGMRYSWLDGSIEAASVSKPPWFDEECIRHF